MPKGLHDARYRKVVSRLVEARKRKGWRQADLAMAIDQHQQFVSRFETGERRLDVIEFAVVALALDLDPGEVVQEAMSQALS